MIQIIGGGLAGCEIALQLARWGQPSRLIEMKPLQRTSAQSSDLLAELVCSNSFRSQGPANAIAQLKWEMERAGSAILNAARAHAVPAGDALAVDREAFSEALTAAIHTSPLIERVEGRVDEIPDGPTVICTGPLTEGPLAQALAEQAGAESLSFYDAIAPILEAESIDWSVVWRQSRYDKGEGADYANIPLDEEGYLAFVLGLIEGEKVEAHHFEDPNYFEGCLPIEVMAERGPLTLAYGPLKPVGLRDPRTGRRPFAVIQLRMENREATAWNMVGFQTRLNYPNQRKLFRSLPGLERAEFLRLGSVHRNSYLDAPKLLSEALHWKGRSDLWIAGQLSGVEGYVESAASGQLIAWHILAWLRGQSAPLPPPVSAFGALRGHLRGEGLSSYGPSNLNWGLFPSIKKQRRERRRDRRLRMAQRAQEAFEPWWEAWFRELNPAPQ